MPHFPCPCAFYLDVTYQDLVSETFPGRGISDGQKLNGCDGPPAEWYVRLLQNVWGSRDGTLVSFGNASQKYPNGSNIGDWLLFGAWLQELIRVLRFREGLMGMFISEGRYDLHSKCNHLAQPVKSSLLICRAAKFQRRSNVYREHLGSNGSFM